MNNDILKPVPFLGDDRYLRVNGANEMKTPFRAVSGTKEAPGFVFQDDLRSGLYYSEGYVWVTNGRVSFPLVRVPDGANVGDLLVWDGSGYQPLPIGTDGQVLTADSGEALGVKWATP